jgi:hypothetical protein
VIVLLAFGNKVCLALLAMARLTNLMVVQLRKVRHAKQSRSIDPVRFVAVNREETFIAETR